MEEEETQSIKLTDLDIQDDLISQFKIMSLKDGKHQKQQIYDFRKQEQNFIEQNNVTDYYQQVNSLLYELRQQYLEKVEKDKNHITLE